MLVMTILMIAQDETARTKPMSDAVMIFLAVSLSLSTDQSERRNAP